MPPLRGSRGMSSTFPFSRNPGLQSIAESRVSAQGFQLCRAANFAQVLLVVLRAEHIVVQIFAHAVATLRMLSVKLQVPGIVVVAAVHRRGMRAEEQGHDRLDVVPRNM